MLISSTITTSASSGLSASRANPCLDRARLSHQANDAVDRCGFAGAGSAGDDHYAVCRRGNNRFALLPAEVNALVLFIFFDLSIQPRFVRKRRHERVFLAQQ